MWVWCQDRGWRLTCVNWAAFGGVKFNAHARSLESVQLPSFNCFFSASPVRFLTSTGFPPFILFFFYFFPCFSEECEN